MKTITQAGGKLNIEMNELILDYCDKNNKKFYVMYGQTEASPRISYLPPQNSRKKIGSIGIPIPDGKLSLIDEKEIKTPGERVTSILWKECMFRICTFKKRFR